VTHLRAEADGTISARRYTIPQAARFVGAWQDSAALAALKPGELTELPGCDIVIVRAGELVWGSAAGGYQFRRVDAAVSPALPAPQSPR
jgi:hypothetical protein